MEVPGTVHRLNGTRREGIKCLYETAFHDHCRRSRPFAVGGLFPFFLSDHVPGTGLCEGFHQYGAYAPYPDNPIGQQELVYWYDSLTTPMTVVAEVPPTPIVTKGPGPVILDSNDFSAKLYRDRTEIKKKDKDGNWVTSVRPTTPADQRMRNYVMASKKAR